MFPPTIAADEASDLGRKEYDTFSRTKAKEAKGHGWQRGYAGTDWATPLEPLSFEVSLAFVAPAGIALTLPLQSDSLARASQHG